MRVNWVIANDALVDPTVDLSALKDIGSFWGSWRTWRSYQTDNVICNDLSKCSEFIQRDFQKHCNFYVPNSLFVNLGRPPNVRLYEGAFNQEVDNKEEIISLHLVASTSDIVLLLGFNWLKQPKNIDKLEEHRAHNYKHLIKHAIQDNPNVQWVLVDHPSGKLFPELDNLANLTQDTLSNVLSMLSS